MISQNLTECKMMCYLIYINLDTIQNFRAPNFWYLCFEKKIVKAKIGFLDTM